MKMCVNKKKQLYILNTYIENKIMMYEYLYNTVFVDVTQGAEETKSSYGIADDTGQLFMRVMV